MKDEQLGKMAISQKNFEDLFFFLTNSFFLLAYPSLVLLSVAVNGSKTTLDIFSRNKDVERHKREIEKLIQYIDLKTININNFSDKQLRIIDDLIRNYLYTTDNEKKDFILGFLKGTLNDKNYIINNYPLEPINRIIRDISIQELFFLKKYNPNARFMLLDKELTSEEISKNIEQMSKEDGNINIYMNSEEGTAICGLINLGLIVSLNVYGPNYYFSNVAKNIITIIEKIDQKKY